MDLDVCYEHLSDVKSEGKSFYRLYSERKNK